MIAEKNHAFRRRHTDGLNVLIENGEKGIYNGLDQYFNRVQILSDEDLGGNWLTVDNVLAEAKGNTKTLR
jgi:hypothetical protein